MITFYGGIYIMRKTILIITLFFVLLFSACSEQAISQSTLNSNSINISEYFATDPNLILTYNTYANTKLYATTIQTSSLVSSDKDSKAYKIIEKTSAMSDEEGKNVSLENQITYKIDTNSIIEIKSVNIGLLGNTNTNPKTILSNKSKWKNKYDDKEECTITGINQTITTKAGTFSNCIEVTEDVDLSNETVSSKKYYAPKVGLILTKLKNKSNYDIIEELVNIKSSTKNTTSSTTKEVLQKSVSEDSSISSKSSLTALSNIQENNDSYSFTLADDEKQKFDINIHSDNGTFSNAASDTSDFCAKQGDKLWKGNFTVSYSKLGDNNITTEKFINYLANNNDNLFTFNTNNKQIVVAKNDYANSPDLLLTFQPETYSVSSIQICYMKNSKLLPITFISSYGTEKTCTTYGTFFKQTTETEFETSSYDNTQTFLFYITKWSFNKDTGEFKEINTRKMTLEEYKNYNN